MWGDIFKVDLERLPNAPSLGMFEIQLCVFSFKIRPLPVNIFTFKMAIRDTVGQSPSVLINTQGSFMISHVYKKTSCWIQFTVFVLDCFTFGGINVFYLFFYFSFINSGCEDKDSQKSELNHCTSQEPSGEKTREEVSVLDVGWKPPRIIPGKTLAIS